jgi:hypothetical protein
MCAVTPSSVAMTSAGGTNEPTPASVVKRRLSSRSPGASGSIVVVMTTLRS